MKTHGDFFVADFNVGGQIDQITEDLPRLLIPVAAHAPSDKHCELWSPNLIGRCYRTLRDERGGGIHASPRVHWRRGHVRSQPHGQRRSLRKAIWIEPVLVGVQPGTGAEKGGRL